MNSREKYLEVLEDAIQFYSEDTSRRAFNKDGYPQYLDEWGRKCPVGRCLKTPPEKNKPAMVLMETLDFLDEYKGLDGSFWNMLQGLHDQSSYWKMGKGMTDEGLARAETIRNYINQYRFKSIKGYYL